MISLVLDYATPSALSSTRERADLSLTSDRRRPVRFHGRVAGEIFLFRLALRTLGEVIWSSDVWRESGTFLDPVITVHPDRIIFEAFSQDQSTYAQVLVDPSLFEVEGEVSCGTTNVDFTSWLWAALAELRSHRETWIRIDAGGFEVATSGSGGRFEQKVELPIPWIRGFLQLMGAMAMPGTSLQVRPVDLLSAIRFLRYTKAKMSPRALRYEFPPGEDARIVLEPWEHVVKLRGVSHHYEEHKVIRTWGRRRLRLIEPLLPFADAVKVYLKGRALPSFYAVKLGSITFILGLSSWSGAQWTETAGFDLLISDGEIDGGLLQSLTEKLASSYAIDARREAESLGTGIEEVTAALAALCRQGRVVYDLENRQYRYRELLDSIPPHHEIFPPDERKENARVLLREHRVTVASCTPRETRKVRTMDTPAGKVTREILYRDWHIMGSAGGEKEVEVVQNDAGSLIFGTCGCRFFQDNLLNRGPCEHMLALLAEGEKVKKDRPASVEAALPQGEGNKGEKGDNSGNVEE
ncbi:MAG: SWIM zinc finger family protein [Candidatus Eremiobacteraeota bacterium]|nr:SWIM zinc finger family protein [Candidatus Eremiobacteraeota bacterium]